MIKSIAAVAGLAWLGISGFGNVGAAEAASINDEYWGGVPSTGPDTDVIGGNRYEVFSLSAERNSTDLVVTVNSNYFYNIGAGLTQMGSLFIGDPSKLNRTGSSPSYVTDTFDADTDRFSYVFDYDIDNSLVDANSTNKAGSLWKLNETGSDVKRSFGTILRNGQAVDRIGGAGTGIDGTWEIGAGNIKYTIANFFTLTGLPTTGLTLAWTMSCANDIILGTVNLANLGPGPDQGPDVPLPAGLVLLVSGLAGLGVAARNKKKI